MESLRSAYLKKIEALFQESPIVGLLGPRQCGKTTLARHYGANAKTPVTFFDLEDPRQIGRLAEPMTALEGLQGLVVLDEIQLRPELFPALRVLADRPGTPARFLVLGSASRDLIRQESETLAGRIRFLPMSGFSLDEIRTEEFRTHWLRGGFPRSYLARDNAASFGWRKDFIRTFLERDIPALGGGMPPAQLGRFWTMLSHYHGQILESSELARSLAVSDPTIRRYLDILTGTFVVRSLQPWFYNTRKRLVKRPKIYVRDSGLFHALMGLADFHDLESHPKLGASWEGYVIEQIVSRLHLAEDEIFFWSVHTGAELDLVFNRRGWLWGVEVKYADAPVMTRSMHSALKELALEHLWVIYPGAESYEIDPRVTVLPVTQLATIKSRVE